MPHIAEGWNDYKIIATGDGYKLERWGEVCLLRPDPQAIWEAPFDLFSYPKLNAYYRAEAGKKEEKWVILKPFREEFTVQRKGLTFHLKLSKNFKHTGLFPEQAANWDDIIKMISAAGREIKVLNLFAYTGGATIAAASAGAAVTHVDAAPAMVDRAKQNASSSGLGNAPIRYIVDDCLKFVNREIRRGNRYDVVIMDPPSFGRGPDGEVWKLEHDLYPLLKRTVEVLSDKPLFFLINSYTTGLQPTVIADMLKLAIGKKYEIDVDAYELALPTEEGIELPCGCSGVALFKG
ncbi:MAG: class I SAM-dependent methyltransferase [Clostridia bacterium]|nr:class I SAM-dependent methyltransferase [Clostridia bacterium]